MRLTRPPQELSVLVLGVVDFPSIMGRTKNVLMTGWISPPLNFLPITAWRKWSPTVGVPVPFETKSAVLCAD